LAVISTQSEKRVQSTIADTAFFIMLLQSSPLDCIVDEEGNEAARTVKNAAIEVTRDLRTESLQNLWTTRKASRG